MKKVILFLVLFCVHIHSFAQKGFLGKRNEVSFDLFNSVYQGKYNFNYKYCLGKNIALKTTYSLLNAKDQVLSSASYTITKTKISASGNSWSIGLLWNSQFTNMPMPIGYYLGMAYERNVNTITENTTVQSYNP